MLAACSSVRCDRSVVLVKISTAAFETSRVDATIAPTVSRSRSTAALKFAAPMPRPAVSG